MRPMTTIISIADKLSYSGNLLIVVIMLVAVYAHLHPDVPAQVLPFQAKPPVVTIIVMLLVVLNIVLCRHVQPKPSRR